MVRKEEGESDRRQKKAEKSGMQNMDRRREKKESVNKRKRGRKSVHDCACERRRRRARWQHINGL